MAEPVLFTITNCDSEDIEIYGLKVVKSNVALILVIFEIITVSVLMISYNLIKYLQVEFSKVYDA